MNARFPTFNFDKWLSHFIEVLYLLDSRNISAGGDWPSFIKKEKFFLQDHGEYDEYGEDLADSYLIDITKFNCFMKFLLATDRTHQEIAVFLLQLEFPFVKNFHQIYNTLKMGKSYKTANGILFPPIILQYINNFCKELKLSINDN